MGRCCEPLEQENREVLKEFSQLQWMLRHHGCYSIASAVKNKPMNRNAEATSACFGCWHFLCKMAVSNLKKYYSGLSFIPVMWWFLILLDLLFSIFSFSLVFYKTACWKAIIFKWKLSWNLPYYQILFPIYNVWFSF